MEIYRSARPRLREIDQECQARLGRLEALAREIEQVRAALDQAEREIAGVWESNLPRHNKLLLTQVIRVRCRHLETTLHRLQDETAATALARLLHYRVRW